MKALKLLTVLFLTITIFNSCVSNDSYYVDDSISLEQLVSSYDLWYIDYNRTTGDIDVPFLSKAFTLSFHNGRLIANNNLVGLGSVGDGYGDEIGYYETINGVLEIDHKQDGFIDLEVVQLSNNEIKLRDTQTNTSYYLIGYQKNNFDYDFVFYDNIEYFLQEYEAWEKTYVSQEGALNDFDNENFLQFTPEQNTTFRSSKDEFGTNVEYLIWDFVGGYEVFDVTGKDDLKILTLDYDSLDNEEFELSVISDNKIDLFHAASGTTYTFNGRNNIIFKNIVGKGKIPKTRKRFKTNRKTKK